MTKKIPEKEILNLIAQAVFDKKGFNILVLDVRNISTMADYFIIAEGNVDRHVKALSGAIKDALQEEAALTPLHVEGEKDGDWIVMDYGHLVIHLFIPELRVKYDLEDLWRKSKIIDVTIDTGKGKNE